MHDSPGRPRRLRERDKANERSLQKNGLRYSDILVELPVTIRNSHLLTSFLHQLPSQAPKEELAFPSSLSALHQDSHLAQPPLYPNYDSLDLSIDPSAPLTYAALTPAARAAASAAA